MSSRLLPPLLLFVIGCATGAAQVKMGDIFGGGQFEDIAVSSDGTWFVTASTRGEADIRDTATLERIRVLGGHEGPVHSVAIVGDDAEILTFDQWYIRRWAADTGELVGVVANVPGMTSIAIAPDETYLLAGTQWEGLKKVVLSTGEVSNLGLTSSKDIVDVAFSLDGTLAAATSRTGLTFVFEPEAIGYRFATSVSSPRAMRFDALNVPLIASSGRIFPAPDENLQPPIQWHRQSIVNMRNLPELGWVASAAQNNELALILDSPPYNSLGYFPAAGISIAPLPFGFDAVAGATGVINRLDLSQPVEAWRFIPSRKELYPIAFSGDGSQFAYHDGAKIVIRDTGSREVSLQIPEDIRVTSLRFVANDTILAAADYASRVRYWSPITGALLATLELPEAGAALKAVPCPDASQVFVLYADGIARNWLVSTKTILRTIEDTDGLILDIDFSSDNSQLLTVHTDRAVRVWPVSGEEPVRVIEKDNLPVWAASFTPDSQQVVVSFNENTISRWSIGSGQYLMEYEGLSGNTRSLSVSTDGTLLGAATFGGQAKTWRLSTGEQVFEANLRIEGNTTVEGAVAVANSGAVLTSDDTPRLSLWDPSAEPLVQRLNEGHSRNLTGLHFSTNGTRMVNVAGPQVLVWDEDQAKPLLQIQPETGVTQAKLSPDGDYVYIGGSRVINKYDGGTGVLLLSIMLQGLQPRDFVVSADGTLIAAATNEGVEIFGTSNGTPYRTFPGVSQSVDLSDDNSLAAGFLGEEGAGLHIWNLQTGQIIQTLDAVGVRQMRFLPSNQKIITAGGAGVTVWNISRGSRQQLVPPLAPVPDAMAVSSDGRFVAFVNRFAGVSVLSLLGNEGQYRIDKTMAQAIAFVPGTALFGVGHQDGTVHVHPALTTPEIECVPPLQVGLSRGIISATELYAYPDTDAIQFTLRNGAGPDSPTYALGCEDLAASPFSLTLTASNGIDSTTCETMVTVVDDVPPIARAKDAILPLEADGLAILDPRLIDDSSEECTGKVLSVDRSLFTCSDLGPQVVQLMVTDAAANTGTAAASVTVVDVTPPVIELTGGDITTECGAPYADPGVSASDACSGDLTGRVLVTGSVDTSSPGQYLLRYDVSDDAGNAAATAERLVTVRDTEPPTISWQDSQPTIIPCGTQPPAPSAVDACDGDLSSMVEIISGELDLGIAGTYAITYGVSDSSGNAATATRLITVTDTAPPSITVIGPNPLLVCGAHFADPGAQAQDACGGTIEVTSNAAQAVDATTPGRYIITYFATDSGGNVATAYRTVQITDTCGASFHSADTNANGIISLSELMRVIQLRNAGGFSCAAGIAEDGYALGAGPTNCRRHDSDYVIEDWQIGLDELLRLVQLYNAGAYEACAAGEDGFCVASR